MPFLAQVLYYIMLGAIVSVAITTNHVYDELLELLEMLSILLHVGSLSLDGSY